MKMDMQGMIFKDVRLPELHSDTNTSWNVLLVNIVNMLLMEIELSELMAQDRRRRDSSDSPNCSRTPHTLSLFKLNAFLLPIFNSTTPLLPLLLQNPLKSSCSLSPLIS